MSWCLFLGSRDSSPLSAPSFQGVVEGDEVSPQPPLLPTKAFQPGEVVTEDAVQEMEKTQSALERVRRSEMFGPPWKRREHEMEASKLSSREIF